MVRSDLGISGVAFSLDTESGFKDAVVINAAYGLGEMIVQGAVSPDEYIVFKPLLKMVSMLLSKLGQKIK
jgi:pyruvate,water dikinase